MVIKPFWLSEQLSNSSKTKKAKNIFQSESCECRGEYEREQETFLLSQARIKLLGFSFLLTFGIVNFR
jgi:hypothetical protein